MEQICYVLLILIPDNFVGFLSGGHMMCEWAGHTMEGVKVHSSSGAMRPVLLLSASLLVLNLTHLSKIQLVDGNNTMPNSCKYLLKNLLEKVGSFDNAPQR